MTEEKNVAGLIDAPQIQNIEILELLGHGGMSVVFKARQKDLDRAVAVKVLSNTALNGEDGIRRFRQEARLTSALDHPNIIKILSFGISSKGQPYLVMEYVSGHSLSEELKEKGRLTLSTFKRVFLPSLSALESAHKAGLVHRDIKPGNIMLSTGDDGQITAKILDFGIAKALQESSNALGSNQLTKTGAVLGSPGYMSPEQCECKAVDGRSDLYSLSCVMYEAVTGQPPFTAESALDVMRQHSMEPPPSADHLLKKVAIKKDLARAIVWGLAKNPDARPQNAAQLQEILSSALDDVSPDQQPQLRAPSAGRKLWIIASACILAVAVSIWAIVITALHQKKVGKQSYSAVKQTHSASERSEQVLRTALARADKYQGKESEAANSCLEKLVEFYRDRQDFTAAEPYLKRLLETSQKHGPPLKIASAAFDLGQNYARLGLYDDAEPFLKQSLAIRKKYLDPDDKDLTYPMNDLATIYKNQGRLHEAEPLFLKVLEIRKVNLSPDDLELAYPSMDLAEVYDKEERYEKAQELSKQALAIASAARERYRGHGGFELREYRNMCKEDQAAQLYERAKALNVR